MHNATKITFNLDKSLYEDLTHIKDTEMGHTLTQMLNRGAKLARDEWLEDYSRTKRRRESLSHIEVVR